MGEEALRRAAVALLAVGGLACGATDETLPPTIKDPASLKTPAGAVARYEGALAILPKAFDWFLTQTGILTDELADLPAPINVAGAYTSIDGRQDLSGFENDYIRLHDVRRQAREARGFVQAYAPDSSPALAGHLYAEEGFAEIFLADLFCSGIPLSTVDFDGDYTLAAGSSTAEVYGHAVTLFDSALALTSDSVRLQHFAAIGRGRALLALGRYTEAAAAVAAVPDSFTYHVVFAPRAQNERLLQAFVIGDESYQHRPATPSMGDHEGLSGLDYRSSGDPRAAASPKGNDVNQQPLYVPVKYDSTGTVTLTIADGIEGRLIEAEAALRANAADGQWLIKLNALRQTAISPALPALNDPGQDGAGTDAPRVDLLFRERAFWLYLTGHRQGDLRRLIRVPYLRAPETVYPRGTYPGGSGSYGREIVAPVPTSEQQLNPKYTGCIHRNA